MVQMRLTVHLNLAELIETKLVPMISYNLSESTQLDSRDSLNLKNDTFLSPGHVQLLPNDEHLGFSLSCSVPNSRGEQ